MRPGTGLRQSQDSQSNSDGGRGIYFSEGNIENK